MALAHFQRSFVDTAGNVQAGIEVTIRNESTGALAAIYEDSAGTTAKANPFTTDSFGYGDFYAADGRYRIQATGIDWRNEEVLTFENLAAAVTDAEEARDAAAVNGNIYADTAAGLAATVDGEYFSTPAAASDDYLTLYRNDAGSATEIDTYPNSTAIDNVFTELDKRTIYVGSVAELEALSLAEGTNVYLTEGGRAGDGVIKSGAHTADPQKGIFIDLANGNYWERLEIETLTFSNFGVVGDLSDETSAIDAALAAFNSSNASTLFGDPSATYKYNGTSLKAASNKTIDMRYAKFITDTGSLCWETEGSYDNHSENITLRRIVTDGFSSPIAIVFADNSTIEYCTSINASNIGIQVLGDDLVGNKVKYCYVGSPGFHCYANNDSVNFDPANTEQGERYPQETSFIGNVAENASQLAYDVHSNSKGGMSRVIGGYVSNCDQIYKNSYGNCIFEGVDIVKSGVGSGSTWLAQVGARDGTDDKMHYFKNNTLTFDSRELIFIIYGNCFIEGNTVRYTGATAVSMEAFFISQGAKTVSVEDNKFFGGPFSYSGGRFFNIRTGISVDRLKINDNEIHNTVTLPSTSEAFFFIEASDYKTISIENNSVYFDAGSARARFVQMQPLSARRVNVSRNSAENLEVDAPVLGSGLIQRFNFEDNENIRIPQRYADLVKILHIASDTEDFPSEIPGDSSGTAETLVKNFSPGAEYEVVISADRSSTAATFQSIVKYAVLVSRDGTALTSGNTVLAGSEANIGAQFQISGSDLQYFCAFTTPVFVRVSKVGQR